MNINQWRDAVHELAKEKGWYEGGEVRNFGEVLINMVSELVEAHEEHRNGRSPTEIYFREDGKPEGIPIEMGDAIIRILDTCGSLGIDIEHAMQLKHEFNKSRPYRHGGKKA